MLPGWGKVRWDPEIDLLAFTTPPPKSISMLMVVFSSLIKSGFCFVWSCEPSPWASTIWHGGQPSCFLGFVRSPLLAGHVPATAESAPVEAGQHFSGQISHLMKRWAKHLIALSREDAGWGPNLTCQTQAESERCWGRSELSDRLERFCSCLECGSHSWRWT